MKIVYLASPYRADSEFDVYLNMHRAHVMARRIWKMGAACISPCSNTHNFGGMDVLEAHWLNGDLEILNRCDAIFLNDGWEYSVGSIAEKEFANGHGIPIFTDINELEKWIKNTK